MIVVFQWFHHSEQKNKTERERILLLLCGDCAEEFLNLSLSLLGGGERAKALLANLNGALFLADAEKLGDTLVESCQAGDFLDNALDGTEAWVWEAEARLARNWAGAWCGLETVVETSDDARLGCFCLWLAAALGRHFFFFFRGVCGVNCFKNKKQKKSFVISHNNSKKIRIFFDNFWLTTNHASRKRNFLFCCFFQRKKINQEHETVERETMLNTLSEQLFFVFFLFWGFIFSS